MNPDDMQSRLHSVQEVIRRSAHQAGRDPSSVTLVAVSKQQPVQALEQAMRAGHTLFGESYAQQLRDKHPVLKGASWHFLGNLQKNKAKYVAPVVDMFHGLDSLQLAHNMGRHRLKAGLPPLPCLLQVNVGGEETKSGLSPSQVIPMLKELETVDGVRMSGFMCLPPWSEDPEAVRPWFKKLSSIAQEARQATGCALPELSMGMSGDYPVAIEEGATIVRVGTAIFGERNR